MSKNFKGYHNEFKIVVRDTEKDEIVQEAYAYNIVLNKFNQVMANETAGYEMQGINYGSGTGTLDVARTTMFNRIGGKKGTFVESSLDKVNGYAISTFKVVVLPAEHIGVTFTEVGLTLESSTVNTYICTHALIEDSEGNPITIGPKTDTQEITFYATVFYKVLNGLDGSNGMHFGTGMTNTFLTQRECSSNRRIGDYAVSEDRMAVPPEVLTSRTFAYLFSSYISYARYMARSNNLKDRIVFETGRLESADANNYNIGSIYLDFNSGGNAVKMVLEKLPSAIWDGIVKTGVPVGTGDGVETDFNMVMRDPKNLVLKVDGTAVTEGVDFEHYPLPYNTNINAGNSLMMYTPTREDVGEGYIINEVSGFVLPDTQPYTNIMFNNHSNFTPTVNAGDYVVFDMGENKKWAIGSMSGLGSARLTYAVSEDKVTWTTISTSTAMDIGGVELDTVPDIPFRYIRVTVAVTGTFRGVEFYTRKNMFEFASPVANASVITADFKIYYLHKDTDHMFDIDMTFLFGYNNPV